MALSPEEARKKAYDSSTEAAVEDVAILLKKQYRNLSGLFPDIAIPQDSEKGDEEYRRMAGELIKDRGFNAKTEAGGTRTITIDELDATLKENGLDPQEKLGVSSLDEAIPTHSQLHATANAVADGVEENTGSVGFLQGATFMSAIKGFFSWMMSGFEGGFDGLKKTIATITAENMRDSVKENLIGLRQERSDMNRMLDNERVDTISDKVHSSVLSAAGFPLESSGGGESVTLRNVKFASIEDNMLDSAQQKIRNGILYEGKDGPLADKIAGNINGAVNEGARDWGWAPLKWVGKNVPGGTTAKRWVGEAVGEAPDPSEVKKSSDAIARFIADRVSTITTDPTYRTKDGRKLADLDRDAYAEAVADDVTEQIRQNKKQFHLHSALEDEIGTLTKKIHAGTKEGIAENYDRIHAASEMAKNAFMENDAYADARKAEAEGRTTVLTQAKDAVDEETRKSVGGTVAQADSGNKSAPHASAIDETNKSFSRGEMM